jgi:hypothetical protein
VRKEARMKFRIVDAEGLGGKDSGLVCKWLEKKGRSQATVEGSGGMFVNTL